MRKISRSRLLRKIPRARLLLKIPRAKLLRKIPRARLMQVILASTMARRILGMWLNIFRTPVVESWATKDCDDELDDLKSAEDVTWKITTKIWKIWRPLYPPSQGRPRHEIVKTIWQSWGRTEAAKDRDDDLESAVDVKDCDADHKDLECAEATNDRDEDPPLSSPPHQAWEQARWLKVAENQN